MVIGKIVLCSFFLSPVLSHLDAIIHVFFFFFFVLCHITSNPETSETYIRLANSPYNCPYNFLFMCIVGDGNKKKKKMDIVGEKKANEIG